MFSDAHRVAPPRPSLLTPLFLSPSPLHTYTSQTRRAPAGHRAAPPQGEAAERGEDFRKKEGRLKLQEQFFLSLLCSSRFFARFDLDQPEKGGD